MRLVQEYADRTSGDGTQKRSITAARLAHADSGQGIMACAGGKERRKLMWPTDVKDVFM